MNKKFINKEIRRVSNYSSLPVLIFIVLILAVQFSYRFIMQALANTGITLNADVQYLILYCIQYLLVVPLALLVFYKMRSKKTGLKLSTCFRKTAMPASWTAKWILIAIGFAYIASIASNLLFAFIQALFGIELKPMQLEFGDSPLAIFTTFFALSILAPFFEELLFRATVYRNNEIMGQWFAIIVSGITFGLWHMNYPQIIFASTVGSFSCFIFAKTRSIIPSMILHFCINTIAGIMLLCYSSIDPELLQTGGSQYMMSHILPYVTVMLTVLLVFGLIITGLVLFIIELAKNRRELALKKSVFPVSGVRKVLVYFSAPLTIILFIYMIVDTVINAII